MLLGLYSRVTLVHLHFYAAVFTETDLASNFEEVQIGHFSAPEDD
jgi:hypothetical protein